MEMTSSARLATLVAMDKQLKPILDDAKSDARQYLMRVNDETGADRMPIKIGDVKVGEIGLSYSKAKVAIDPSKRDEALHALQELGLTELTPIKGWEEHFELIGDQIVSKDSGEVVEGFVMEQPRVKTAVVRGCKPNDVTNAFKALGDAPSAFALLEEMEDY